MTIPEWLTKPEWLTAIGTIGATAVALFLAIAGDRIRWRRQPRLALTIRQGPPDKQAIDVGEWSAAGEPIHPIDAYRVRASINNRGAAATNVEVRLTRWERADGVTFSDVRSFVPSNLRWADGAGPTTRVIHRNIPKQCDLLQIVDWEEQREPMRFELYTVDKSMWGRAGRYRLHVALACDEVDPVYQTIEIDYDGGWSADSTEFFRAHLLLSVSPP